MLSSLHPVSSETAVWVTFTEEVLMGNFSFCPMLVMRGFFEQNQKFSLCYLSFPQPLPHLNVYVGHPIYSN